MKTIRIYRHLDCERCAKMAATHHKLDWLDRVDDTTEPPPGRWPVEKGEILVQNLRNGAVLEGIDAVRAIARQVPLYWAALPLLRIPWLARWADLDARGCSGNACAVS
jgi:hypothetical protein